MPNLPSIVITSVEQTDIPERNLAVTPTQSRDIWSNYLSLKISTNTQRAYAKAIADFGSPAHMGKIG